METATYKDGLFFERVTTEGMDYKLSDSACGVHRKIIRYVGSNKKVLDVGCGSGYLGEIFKKNGCWVAGIESDCNRARQAQGLLDGFVKADIESLEKLDYPEGFFDCIVLADVLEHLRRPDAALILFRRYLNDNGYLVVSIPNVARLDVRLKFLCGKFDYDNGGILDKTHLRFFTEKTARKLLEGCGYSITKVDYSGFFSKFRMPGPFSGMLAFQFIFLAKPVKD